ncbi:MAG: maltose alpha-D-glucosyltransferase [Thiohalobacteraceae bacterium]
MRVDDPLWYKDAIIYELHVKAFFDSGNDGKGDFRGLTEKLEYLQELGVNTLWLLPFYPSPQKDDGYDISDYHAVHPDYGSMADFRQFVRAAHQRGLKVITELVINHTSDQHAWFQAARRAPRGSRKRDYYVWNDDDKKFPETRIIFSDTEISNWTWDPVARAYYWHRFFSHQPDLNHNNPQVVKAMVRVMRFWFDIGVDGVRLDAIPYLCVREGTDNENLPETHAVIRYMRAELDRLYDNRMFLAEANQWPEDVREYFGNGDECHMAYHFPLMPRIYVALAQEDRHPIVEIMRQTPDIPDNCQWAIFLRNHDELTLEMVTDRERDYMYQIYAVDPQMRLNVGIRRRLAPLMDNNRDKIELLNSLLMSMPGSPIIYYGDEIGMGNNLFLGDRNGVRTPMQWTPDRNAGFSRADPERLYLPPMMDPVYGYQAVNVEAQLRNPGSLLAWMTRLIAVRKAHRAFGRGTLEFLDPGNRKILAYLRVHEDEILLCVVNLSRSAQPVELNLSRYVGHVPVELMGHTAFPPIGDLPYLLTLPGYGFYWFSLSEHAEVPPWHEEHLPPMELPVLVLPEGWRSLAADDAETEVRRLLAGRARRQLERDILPAYLPTQRWFSAKGQVIEAAEILEMGEWSDGARSWLLTGIRVRTDAGDSQDYLLPLATAWEGDEETLHRVAHWTLTRIRQRARIGVMFDALADDGFCHALLDAIRTERHAPLAGGELRFLRTEALAERDPGGDLPVYRPPLEQSNTAVFYAEDFMLKVYRKLREGVNPELEMGRFLTEVAHFPRVAPLLGGIEYRSANGECVTLGLLQGFVPNQGNAWSYTLDYLERFLADHRLVAGTDEPTEADPHSAYLALMETLGRRTAELHAALAIVSGDPAFDPEPIVPDDLAGWSDQIRQDIVRNLDRLATRRAELSLPLQAQAERLLAAREPLSAQLDALGGVQPQSQKTRHHGDYHLGQVLLVQNDFFITDFEGEPARPLAERRAKHSPLRDVAGMLRSFQYAAGATLENTTRERPEDRPVYAPLIAAWRRDAAAAFLAGYREIVPAAPETEGLLRLFGMEKALYELGYELDNRPDWIGIPIAGLLELSGLEGL